MKDESFHVGDGMPALFYMVNRRVDVFQVTVVFVFAYNNEALYEHEKTGNLQ